MVASETSWDSALARSRAELHERSKEIVLRKAALVLGWHLALWSVVLLGIAVSLTVEHRTGIGSAASVVAGYSILSALLGWGFLRTGHSGTLVVSALLASDGLMLVGVLSLFVPSAPVALGVAVLPAVGLAVVGGARIALALAIVQNGLIFVIWSHRVGAALLPELGIAPGGNLAPLDVAAFAALSTTAALLATVAARSGFSGMNVLRNELAIRTRHLAAANAVLATQNDALESFNTAVGHDLRGPLTTARLAVELVHEDCTDGEQRECISDALEAIERLSVMVEDLLQVARDGGAVSAREELPLGLIVKDALANLAALIRSSGGRIAVCGELPHVVGNRTLLAEVLQNLIENGLKYGAPTDPRIHISGGQVGDLVFLEVEDNGGGIPAHAREQVFQAFQQLDNRSAGVGAGLSLVRRLVEAHGGTIEVDDGQILGGACFRVRLPAPELEAEAMAAR
jgi:signal transduction histidine kinase